MFESVGKVVMVLAATNFPWDIDEALRRRLGKTQQQKPVVQLDLIALLTFLCLQKIQLIFTPHLKHTKFFFPICIPTP